MHDMWCQVSWEKPGAHATTQAPLVARVSLAVQVPATMLGPNVAGTLQGIAANSSRAHVSVGTCEL